MNIQYRDRQTNALISEKIHAEKMLRWLYENGSGRQVLNYCLNHAAFCQLYGKWQDLAWTRSKILPFAQRYGIDLAEIELPIEQYHSFNQFFARRLRPNARPFVADPTVFSAPVDGKILVLSDIQEHTPIAVKGIDFSAVSLLDDPVMAQRYQGGTALVFRLAPYDYHRFHFPVAGIAQSSRMIPGGYDSVHPIALHQVPDVFCRNQRCCSVINTTQFGRIAYVEIGALTVGSIVQTYQPGAVDKGQEKGHFQYGGSTVVLLLEPGTIVVDADLLQDSAKSLEVHVLAGTQIGKQS